MTYLYIGLSIFLYIAIGVIIGHYYLKYAVRNEFSMDPQWAGFSVLFWPIFTIVLFNRLVTFKLIERLGRWVITTRDTKQ